MEHAVTVIEAVCPTCKGALGSRRPGGLCPRCLLQASLRSESPRAPSGAFTVPSLEELGALLPAYELESVIGRGGMGVVYRAQDRRLGRPVAIKVLPAELGADPEFEQRFDREIRALARLSHPFVVKLYDSGEAGPYFYFVLELVEGKNLRAAMKEITPERALALIARTCEALAYAHERGVVHRDLKPENVLVDAQGSPRLADFGLAKLVGADDHGSSFTRTQALLGSPHYMPPEQLQGSRDLDHRADVYAIGAVLYELLTGSLPLGRFPLPSATRGVPKELDAVVLRCLERDAPARFQSADELRLELEALREELSPCRPGVARRARAIVRAAPPENVPGVLVGIVAASFVGVIGLTTGCALDHHHLGGPALVPAALVVMLVALAARAWRLTSFLRLALRVLATYVLVHLFFALAKAENEAAIVALLAGGLAISVAWGLAWHLPPPERRPEGR